MVAWAAFRTIVVNDDGNRNVPYANRNGKRWNRNWNWLDNDFNSNERIALCGNWQQISLMIRNVRRVRTTDYLSHPPAEHFAHLV